MAAPLPADQALAVKEFVDHISNNSYSNPSNPTANDTNPAQNNGITTTTTAATAGSSRAPPITVSAATAVKFLFARKFDVKRAVALFEQHEQIRQRENLHQLDAGVEPLHTELETGKFTILPGRDSSGAAIALFTANLHTPLTVTHQTTLQGVVYQLDVALQSADTQRSGLVFIYDMSSSKYSHFDYDLSQKILTLLKGGYPARLKKVLIVTAPLWFKAPFKILRLFVREKLRERVFTVSVPQLSLHVPRESLPQHLGGTALDINHSAWLRHCERASMTNRRRSNSSSSSSSPPGAATATAAAATAAERGAAAADSGDEDELLANVVSSSSNGDANQPQQTTTTTTTTTTTSAATSSNSNSSKPTTTATATTGKPIPIQTTSSSTLASKNCNNLQLIINAANCIGNTCIPSTECLASNLTPAPHSALPTLTTTTTANGTAAASASAKSSTEDANNPQQQQQQQQQNQQQQQQQQQQLLFELWSENPPSSASSGFSDDDSLAGAADSGADPKTIAQVVEMVRERGRHGLQREYGELRERAPEGTFQHARLRANLAKNRYTDVLCFDHSRVVLSLAAGAEPTDDYINANFVDGYKQRNAYISTQGPLPKTAPDFWRMVWEQQCLVIVMTTRVMERGRAKCHQYWETETGQSCEYGAFGVQTLAVETNEEYTVSKLRLTNNKTDEWRIVSHWQFTSWPDYGVPSSAEAMLNFLQKCREQQAHMVAELGDTWAGHPRGPPIVVHCSAGIGRTGTFITLDICISRLEDVRTVDIRGTVEKIRSQRAYSIQMPDQYVFCHLAFIEYALNRGFLQPGSTDLKGFDGNDDDSE